MDTMKRKIEGSVLKTYFEASSPDVCIKNMDESPFQ
jgi:hypothetical protein